MIYLYRGTCAEVCAAGYVNETLRVICQSAKIKRKSTTRSRMIPSFCGGSVTIFRLDGMSILDTNGRVWPEASPPAAMPSYTVVPTTTQKGEIGRASCRE